MSKHTPGPWEILDNESNTIIAHTNRGMFTVASLKNQSPQGDEKHANARLIAAVPALVEALDGLHHWILQILQSDIADDAVALRPPGADVANAGRLLAEIDKGEES